MEAMFLAGLIVGFLAALVAVYKLVLHLKEAEPPTASEQEEWERAYDQAMQSRDWQTCEILIDERATADWYVPEEAESDA